MALKRYLVFAFEVYYPCGGWEDFKGDFDTIPDAFACAKQSQDDNCQIIDTETRKDIFIRPTAK